MAAPKKNIDRIQLEVDYRAGVKSLRALSKEYGISASRITQIATEDGWERDLAAKIKAKTASKLNSLILNANLNAEKRRITENEVVEANAQVQADIIMSHRADIRFARELVRKLTLEIEATTDGQDLLAQLSEILASQVSTDQARAFHRVIALPSRIGGVKNLVDALKSLVAMEREAFSISSTATPGQTLDAFLRNALSEPPG